MKCLRRYGQSLELAVKNHGHTQIFSKKLSEIHYLEARITVAPIKRNRARQKLFLLFMEIETVVICMIKCSGNKIRDAIRKQMHLILILEGKLKTSTELEVQIQDCPKI